MKLNRKLMTAFAFTALLLVACGGKDSASEMNAAYEEVFAGATDDYAEYKTDEKGYETAGNSAAQNMSTEDPGLNEQMALDRKLIKNATLSFQTDSLDARKRIVNKAVQKFNAYVEHEEQYSNDYQETVTTTLRVPATNFDPMMDAITAGVGSFDSKIIEVDDVTEEFVDVEARINTKKELKERFIALLDRAETIAKIMEVEREINALQAEIESYEGRLKYLSGSVKYATINLTYYRTIEVPVKFDNKFENAFSNGWQGTIWFFVGLVSIWPMLILITLILLILKLKLGKKKG